MENIEENTAENWRSVDDLALGDMVVTPDRRCASVRLLGTFPEGTLGRRRRGGFVILGDFDALLVAGLGNATVTAYVPIETVPPQVAGSELIAEGRSGFLAPHLPADASALEPLSWRAYRLPGKLEPIIVIYRGPQLLAFLPANCFSTVDIDVIRLPRTGSDVVSVNRYATVVDLPAPQVPALPSIRTRTRPGRLSRLSR